MTRSSFLLLDANIVIQLFKSGAWHQFRDQCTDTNCPHRFG